MQFLIRSPSANEKIFKLTIEFSSIVQHDVNATHRRLYGISWTVTRRFRNHRHHGITRRKIFAFPRDAYKDRKNLSTHATYTVNRNYAPIIVIVKEIIIVYFPAVSRDGLIMSSHPIEFANNGKAHKKLSQVKDRFALPISSFQR